MAPRIRLSIPAAPENPTPRNAVGIAPPGKLRQEDRDAALTGVTRSLKRRVLGLDVLQTTVAAKKPPVRAQDKLAG